MFQTFARHHLPPEQRPDKGMLSRCESRQDASQLWFARRLIWPLQELCFQGMAATPRALSALERIMLHIHMVMADNPPNSAAIARELAIHDKFFVDEVLSDLASLGACQRTAAGQTQVTDLGLECCRRGELPSEPRKLLLPLLLDPIAGDFPGRGLCQTARQRLIAAAAAPATFLPFEPADPRRVDLETIRRAASSQGLLTGEDVLFTGGPLEPGDSSPTDPRDGAPVIQDGADRGGILPVDLSLLLSVNEQGQANLLLRDRQLNPCPAWFQETMEACLRERRIGWHDLLGDLAGPAAAAGAKPHLDIPGVGQGVPLERIPALAAQNRILQAVAGARRSLLAQARALPGSPAAPLSSAIVRAADRGVQCRLLWDDSLAASLPGSLNGLSHHANVQHRIVSAAPQEILVADDRLVLGSSPCRIGLAGGIPPITALMVSCSRDRLVCKATADALLAAWNQAEPGDLMACSPQSPAATATSSGASMPQMAGQDDLGSSTRRRAS